MTFIITKEFAFEAAHHLPQMPEGHKCKRPHGHSYRVIVELQAEKLGPESGFVIDFGELAPIKNWLDEVCDHRDLSEVYGAKNTTAERLARLFFDEWRARFPHLTAVTVCETAKTSATYRPEQDAGKLAIRILNLLKHEANIRFGSRSRWPEL